MVHSCILFSMILESSTDGGPCIRLNIIIVYMKDKFKPKISNYSSSNVNSLLPMVTELMLSLMVQQVGLK